MKFQEQNFITVDDNPNGSHRESRNTFLVGETSILEWTSDSNECGEERSWLYPAYVDGKRGFLVEWQWYANSPYCASGDGERLISLEDGIKILIENGVYNLAFQKEKTDESN